MDYSEIKNFINKTNNFIKNIKIKIISNENLNIKDFNKNISNIDYSLLDYANLINKLYFKIDAGLKIPP